MSSAWKIQLMIRSFVARRRVMRVMEDWARKAVAAVVVQRYWRWREGTFQHAVTKVVVMQRRSRARAFLTFKPFSSTIWPASYAIGEARKEKKSAARLAIEEKMRRERVWRARNQGATVIQRFFLSSRDNFLSRSCSLAVRARRQAGFSHAISSSVMKGESGEVGYIRPGFRQSGPQFGAALAQREVYCSGSFDNADGVMLAALLRHSSCEIRTLIFHNIADGGASGIEEHILPALRKCASIRRVAILGGSTAPPQCLRRYFAWYKLITLGLCTCLERCNHLETDRHCMKRYVTELSALNATLLMDYFNYCLPGIRTLSLHGSYLRDEDLALLLDGLRVNSSLRRLSLGLNVLTDDGLIAILGAVTEESAPQRALAPSSTSSSATTWLPVGVRPQP